MASHAALYHLIAERDRHRCAYCLTTEENCGLQMRVDDIIPEAVGGMSTADNLCLACFSCNIHKAAQQSGADPATGDVVSLFQPLCQKWTEHFAWNDGDSQIIGLTPCGRATVAALHMNNPIMVRARRRWVAAGWHPPTD